MVNELMATTIILYRAGGLYDAPEPRFGDACGDLSLNLAADPRVSVADKDARNVSRADRVDVKGNVRHSASAAIFCN